MPSNHKLFKKLSSIDKELETTLDLYSFKRGEALYGASCAIDPAYSHKGLSRMFWSHIIILGYLAGWKCYYSRISCPISLKMITQLGAEVVKEVAIDGKEKIWMVRMNKDSFTPIIAKAVLNSLKKVIIRIYDQMRMKLKCIEIEQ
jgi:hypothetical protein